MNIYDFIVKRYTGEEISLSEYKNKVLLIVNTATSCGFTPQYKGLQELYEKYHNQGFEILDFPCNQFGHQAEGTNQEIHEFCTLKYKTTFPSFEKIDVNGANEHPLYTFLKEEKHSLLINKIKWNFTKFLVDRNGQVYERYEPIVAPENIEHDIKKLLQ